MFHHVWIGIDLVQKISTTSTPRLRLPLREFFNILKGVVKFPWAKRRFRPPMRSAVQQLGMMFVMMVMMMVIHGTLRSSKTARL